MAEPASPSARVFSFLSMSYLQNIITNKVHVTHFIPFFPSNSWENRRKDSEQWFSPVKPRSGGVIICGGNVIG